MFGENHAKISDLQLKISLWFITHKILLKKIFSGFLIGLCVILYGFSIIQAVKILIFQKDDYQTMIADLTAPPAIDYPALREKQKSQDLELTELKIFKTTEGRYDLVAMAKNSNPNFIVRKLNYRFVQGDQVLAENQTHFWPEETKPLVAFGVTGAPSDVAVAVQITDIVWQRLKNPLEFEKLLQERQRFDFDNVEFISPLKSVGGSQSPASRVEFTVKNLSIFDFWEVGFYAILFSGAEIVGASFVEVPQFKSMEARQVSVAWFNPAVAVSRVEIIPEVDVLDESVYLGKEMEVGEEK